MKNVFEALRRYGHDDHFEPKINHQHFKPIKSHPNTEEGHAERLAVYRKRIENGQPLWHPDDFKPAVDAFSKSPLSRLAVRRACGSIGQGVVDQRRNEMS